MTLQRKFLLVLGAIVTVFVTLIAGVTYLRTSADIEARIAHDVDLSRRKIMDLLTVTDTIMAQRVQNSMRLLKQQGQSLGPASQGEMITAGGTAAPDILLGKVAQANNFELVDGLTRIMDGTATIFSRYGDDYIRISTNVIKDGKRAIGTKLSPNGKAIQKIEENAPYYGEVDILGMPFLTAYEPLVSESGAVIGIWYVGYSADLSILDETIAKQRVLERGFVALLDGKGSVRLHSQNITVEAVKEAVSGSDDYSLSNFEFEPWGYRVVIGASKSEASAMVREEVLLNILWVVIGAIVLIGAVHYLVRLTIGNRLALYIQAIGAIARGEGDLTVQFSQNSNDELGQMARGFNQLLERVRSTISEISELVGPLRTATESLSGASVTSTESARSLSREAKEVAGAVHQLSDAADTVAGNAQKAEHAAREAGSQSTSSFSMLEESIGASEKQASDLSESMEVVTNLAKASEDIGGVLDVISEIADQTNLLALNAAIEAARAGEQGRGFAVVADEVRALASRTQDSTTDIHDMIEKLQVDSRRAVELIERNKNLSAENVENIREAGNALKFVCKQVDEIANLNQTISNSAGKQREVAINLAERTESIKAAGDTNREFADQVAQLTQELSGISERLMSTIKTYRV